MVVREAPGDPVAGRSPDVVTGTPQGKAEDGAAGVQICFWPPST